ncbi:MAG: DNA replication/repair protein RecF [Culicoidibacterales bacterium]
MKLAALSLQYFRNYQTCQLVFNENIVIIVGNNAQGKTNLVEAIYTLAFSKSYRAKSEKELITIGQEFGKIQAKVRFDNQPKMKKIDYILSHKSKKVRVNNVEQKTKSDFVGLIKVIKFSPEDLDLVKGSPAVRRKFMDMYISQIDKQYLISLMNYNRLLKQKNALLKQKNADLTLLGIYNDKLSEFIEIIIERRKKFIDLFSPIVQRVFLNIVENKEEFGFKYVSAFESITTKADILAYLTDNLSREVKNFGALVGIQKDDLTFFIDNKNARQFGSQGQQRTIVLTLIIALVEYMHEQIGEYPILILDDVMSELDEYRKIQLLAAFKSEMQIFLTTTSVADIIDKIVNQYELYKVQNGKIERVGD